MTTTRRAILTAIGLSPLAALPAAAAVETPEEKLIRLTQEIMAVAAEVYPIDGWLVQIGGGSGSGVTIHGMCHKLFRQNAPEETPLYHQSVSPSGVYT